MKSKKILVAFNILVLSCCLLFSSCGTIVPENVAPPAAYSYDSTTPLQYAEKYNNGVLAYEVKGKIIYDQDVKAGTKIGEVDAVIVTPRVRAFYNNLIDQYKIQFLSDEKVKLSTDNGGSLFIDRYGNSVWRISADYYGYYQLLLQKTRNHDAPDSAWDKIKDTLFGK